MAPGFDRLLIIVLSFVPVLTVLALRITTVLVACAIWVVCMFVVFVCNRLRERVRTMGGLRFEKLLLDDKKGIPLISVSRKPWFKKKRHYYRIELAHVRLPSEKSSIYAETVKYLKDRLESAKRIEVDYRIHEVRNGNVFGHVFLDDRHFNLDCLKGGRLELYERSDKIRATRRMRKVAEHAEYYELGAYSKDPTIDRNYLFYKELGGVYLPPLESKFAK